MDDIFDANSLIPDLDGVPEDDDAEPDDVGSPHELPTEGP